MWALSLALTILSLWLLILNLSHPNVPVFLYWAEDTLLAVGYSTVGAVAASHRPGNPVGWVLCSIGLSWGWPISPASMPPTRCWQRQGRSRLLKPRPGSTLGFGFLVWVSSCSCLCCSQVVVCLLLAGVHSRGSASCWRGRERSWRRSLRHRALALASGILSGWRVCRTSPSSFRRSCSLDIRRISLLGRAPVSRERGRAPADQMGSLCRRTGGRRLSSYLHRLGSGGSTMASFGWIRVCVGWNRGSPDGSGHSHNALQALRDRHPHKPHPGIWHPHGYASGGLLRRHHPVAEVLRRPHRREVHPRVRCLHPLDRRFVHPSTPSHPVVH